MMHTISNTRNDNHLLKLIELFENNSEVICVSPFLMEDFSSFFFQLKSYPKSLYIITSLKPNEIEQFSKITSIRNLFSISKKYNINLHVFIDEKLHGKVYIGKNAEKEPIAIVTSANFTNNGLTNNHEWGIMTQEPSIIALLEKGIFNDVDYKELTEETLKKMEECIHVFNQNNLQLNSTKVSLNLASLLHKNDYLSEKFTDTNITYWLKPVGVSDDPVKENWIYKDDDPQHFAKRPKSVRKGDILICYGVGVRKILSVYRVEGQIMDATENEKEEASWKRRWHWYVPCKNLTHVYGENWAKHNLRIGSLLEKFREKYPNENATLTSKKLGGLNWKADKLRLNPLFARFIIDKVLEIEQGYIK